MSTTGLVAWLVAGLVALLSPIILNPLLARVGVLDVPNERSSHTRTTLRGGGVAQLLAVSSAGIIGVLAVDPGTGRLILGVFLVSACSMGLLGLLEDTRGVPIATRAGWQLVAGVSATAAVITVTGASWWWLPVLGVAFAAYVNVTNFMDGINGISSFHGLAAGSSFAVLGVICGEPWLGIAGGLTAFAFASFLPWNFAPPGLFLGDVGSYLLGGSIAGLAAFAILVDLPLVAVVGPLSVYLTDTGVTLLRRIFSGETWFMPHRQHAYQRLVDRGWSHMHVSVVVTSFTVLSAAGGMLGALSVTATPVIPWSIIVALAVTYQALPSLYFRTPLEGL